MLKPLIFILIVVIFIALWLNQSFFFSNQKPITPQTPKIEIKEESSNQEDIEKNLTTFINNQEITIPSSLNLANNSPVKQFSLNEESSSDFEEDYELDNEEDMDENIDYETMDSNEEEAMPPPSEDFNASQEFDPYLEESDLEEYEEIEEEADNNLNPDDNEMPPPSEDFNPNQELDPYLEESDLEEIEEEADNDLNPDDTDIPPPSEDFNINNL